MDDLDPALRQTIAAVYADKHFGRCLASTEDDRYPAWLADAAGG